MTQSRPVAGLIGNTQRGPGVELVAGRRPMFVNSAADLTADLTCQRNTARRSVVGTFHAHKLGRERYRHFDGNTNAIRRPGQFRWMEIHPVAGAAGTAVFADRGRGHG